MKSTINKFMIVLFGTVLGSFICLVLSITLIGSKNTEKSLKAIFNERSYIVSYQKILPITYKDDTNEMYHNSNILGRYHNRNIYDKSNTPPLKVPSNGIAPRAMFLYTGPLSERKHEGIDIWTNERGSGMDALSYKKGNPVYASCSGYVKTVWEENGDVAIICDKLDTIYKDILPSLEIKTLYGHMADQFSDEVYIYVKEGQRVNQGDLIGHQGNRCYWSPQNTIVHLHFGVYDISKNPQIPLDPTLYIGVSCTTLNQEFIVK